MNRDLKVGDKVIPSPDARWYKHSIKNLKGLVGVVKFIKETYIVVTWKETLEYVVWNNYDLDADDLIKVEE